MGEERTYRNVIGQTYTVNAPYTADDLMTHFPELGEGDVLGGDLAYRYYIDPKSRFPRRKPTGNPGYDEWWQSLDELADEHDEEYRKMQEQQKKS